MSDDTLTVAEALSAVIRYSAHAAECYNDAEPQTGNRAYHEGRLRAYQGCAVVLRRVSLEPTVPAAAIARIVALRDHWARLQERNPDGRVAGDAAGLLGQVLSIIAEEAPEPTGEEDSALLDALGAMQSDWWKVEVNSHGVSISVFDYDKGKWRGWIETDDRDLRAALRQLAEQQAGAK